MGKNNGAREAQKLRMRGRIALWEEELGTLQVEQIVDHLIGVTGLINAVQQEEAKAILLKQFESGVFDASEFKGVIHDTGKVEKLFDALHRGGFLQQESFRPNASTFEALGMRNLR